MSAMLPLVLALAAPPLGLDALNTDQNELAVAVTPDGGEVWLERRTGAWGAAGEPSRLLHARRDAEGGAWSAPAPPGFANGDASHGDPFFDAATNTLYFVSDRPHPSLGASGGNIWRVTRGDDGAWLAPVALPAPVNSAGEEFSPVLRNGRLYFASDRGGDGDLYVASRRDNGWSVAPLGAALNSATGEWNLWVSPEEELVVFEASGRAGNVSAAGDLYASAKDGSGAWLPAVPLSDWNGPGSELNPRMVVGTLVFASTSPHRAQADLYAADVDVRAEVLQHHAHRLHVVNRSSHTVSRVDLALGAVDAELPIGPGPHLVSASADGVLAVPAYGQFPEPHPQPVTEPPPWVEATGGDLLLIEPGAEAPPRRLRLPCAHPHGSAWDPAQARLWVTCEDRLGVLEVGLDDGAFQWLPTGRAGAHVLRLDPLRAQLLAAHTSAGGVAFIDLHARRSTFLAIAPGTEALWLDPSRAEAWMTVGPSDELAVVDLEQRTLSARVPAGCDFPIDLAADARGLLWVACLGSEELVAVDTRSRRVRDRIALPTGPLNLVAHPTLPVLYASLPRRNRVVELSLTGRRVTRSFATGIEPDGLAITPRP